MEYVLEILANKGPSSSSDIQKELVLKYGLSTDSARKRIQRLYEKGEIERFIRLKAGGYLYFLPDIHDKDSVVKSTKERLDTIRPQLGRIVKAIDTFKVLSVFEICRLSNINAITKNRQFSLSLKKILEELKLLEYNLNQSLFLTSCSLEASLANRLIGKAESNFEEEANLLYIVRDFFLEHRLANNLQLYRTPSHLSLVNKFDAYGDRGWRKKGHVIIEGSTRRTVLVGDMIGYYNRVFSTIYKGKKHGPVPTSCYVLAYNFDSDALGFALGKGIRPIRVDYSKDRNFSFHEIEAPPKERQTPLLSFIGRYSDSKGRAFETAVEKAFKHEDVKTYRRKYFYMDNGDITEEITGHILTDVDILIFDNKNRKAILIECKSAKKQEKRTKLLSIVKDFDRIASYLHDKKDFSVSAVIVGNFNELDMVDASRRSITPIIFFTPQEFYEKYKEQLKGEPKWLFSL